MTLAIWLAFLLASLLIAITPGPGAVISMSTGIRHGYRSALAVIAGLQAAILIHLSIVGVGLGAVLAASELAFSLVKFIGAAYLVWLGVEKWRGPAMPVDAGLAPVRRQGLFLQGLLVNLTNPKAVIFIGALVPQFVNPGAPTLPQYSLIAVTLCLTDILIMSVYALAALRLGRWLRDPQAIRLQNRLFGGLFVSAGALLAGASRS